MCERDQGCMYGWSKGTCVKQRVCVRARPCGQSVGSPREENGSFLIGRWHTWGENYMGSGY